MVICQLSFVVGRGPASRTNPKRNRGAVAGRLCRGFSLYFCPPILHVLGGSLPWGGWRRILNSRKRRERREDCRAGIGAEGSEGSAGGTVALGCLCIVLFELPVCRLSQLPYVPRPPAGRPSTFRGRWASSVRGFFAAAFRRLKLATAFAAMGYGTLGQSPTEPAV